MECVQALTKAHVDVMGAILLHYVVFRYSIVPTDAYHDEYVAWKRAGKCGPAPRLKAYSDFVRERGAFEAARGLGRRCLL